MGLNIAAKSGDFLPYVKYNGKAGRWYVKKDDQEQEVTDPAFVADFDTIQTGWFMFMEGQAPSVILDKSLTEPAAQPSDKHKRGFRLQLFSQNAFGGVVELQGASMHLSNAISEIYDQYETGRGANAGLLPVVQVKGTTPMKDKMGTNYRPNLSILKWVPRPAEFTPVANVVRGTSAAQDALPPEAKAQPAPVAAQPQAVSVSEF